MSVLLLLVVALVTVALGVTEKQVPIVAPSSSSSSSSSAALVKHKEKHATRYGRAMASGAPGSAVTCNACNDFLDEFENTLLNAVLQVGIAGTCEEVCSFIPNEYGVALCTILCLGVGLDEFVNLLSNADLDPIYICAELDACPTDTCGPVGCTQITTLAVTPSSGKLRSTFTFSVTVKALKNTGTGVTVVVVPCPGCMGGALGWEMLNEGFTAGQTYVINSTLDTSEMDWQYQTGINNYAAYSCRYDCGDGSSTTQHGYVWSTMNGTFTIQ